MRTFRSLLLCLICTIGLCTHPSVAKSNTPTTEFTARAKEEFALGRDLFAQNRFSEAADAFRRAYDIIPTWKLLYNLGQAEAAAKRYDLAISAFEQYLADAGDDITEDRSREVISEINRLRMLVGIVEVDAPSGAQLTVDDLLRGTLPFNGPIRVPIGTHRLKITFNDETLLDQEITVAGGMTTAVSVGQVNSQLAVNRADATSPLMVPKPRLTQI